MGEPSTLISNKIRFGFIMFENHPYGRVILQELIKNGYVPTICIEERSETGIKRCQWYNKQLSSFQIPLVEDLVRIVPFNRVIVEDQNNNVTKNALMEANLDVIFLGGAGIIEENIFSSARLGTLNTHPGILPDIRGSLPVPQSIVRGIPIGVTLHSVTSDLDCGPWVDQIKINITKSLTFEDIIFQSCITAAELFFRALKMIEIENTIIQLPQLPRSAFGPCFKWSSTVEQEARDILNSQSYLHYCE